MKNAFQVFFFLMCIISPLLRCGAQQPVSNEVVSKLKWKKYCLKPSHSAVLDNKIPEGSGLAAWNGMLWTHNDSGKAKLFAIDTIDGSIAAEYRLPGTANNDWEEISQDEDHFYIGDFGNNLGKRDTLYILRINKQSLLQQKPQMDTIAFTWPQIRIRKQEQKINFNCEAMVIINDSIFLFTKDWKKGRCTRVFSLPARPGLHTAHYKTTLKTRVLVTGASYNQNRKKLVLCGYNLLLRPFLLEFREINGPDFFAQKAVRIKIRRRFRQVEGITTFDGQRYFIISENFKFLFIHTRQQLHTVDLTD